jgi:hypothetical protein
VNCGIASGSSGGVPSRQKPEKAPLAGLVEVPQVGLIAGGMVGQPLAEMRDAGLVEGLEAVAAGLTLRS